MDLATMFVILVFGGSDAAHFTRAHRNMGACLSSLKSERDVQRTSVSAEGDYVIYRVCVPVSPRLFDEVARKTEDEPSAPCGRGALRSSTTGRAEMLYLQWTGEISAPLYKRMAVEFEKWKKRVRTVYFQISSCGGGREGMERTIRLLRRIKETHALETIVGRGDMCGSACVPVFLQGQRRLGALTSSWLFHEVLWTDRNGAYARVDRTITERLFQDYYEPAGVSERWLNHLRTRVQQSDYWQTGENLWQDKSGIMTDVLDNLVPRRTEQPRF